MNPDQFFEGLTRVRLEDLRHKYGIPRDIKPELLAAILAFMEADDAPDVTPPNAFTPA